MSDYIKEANERQDKLIKEAREHELARDKAYIEMLRVLDNERHEDYKRRDDEVQKKNDNRTLAALTTELYCNSEITTIAKCVETAKEIMRQASE